MNYYAEFNCFTEYTKEQIKARAKAKSASKSKAKSSGKNGTAGGPATADEEQSSAATQTVRSKEEIMRRQELAKLALDEEEAITAAALSEIEAERPETFINESGIPDEQVKAIFKACGIHL